MELCKRLQDLQTKGNSRTFKHPYSKSTVFQGLQGLEKALVKFKHFQALQGPVRTLNLFLCKQLILITIWIILQCNNE